MAAEPKTTAGDVDTVLPEIWNKIPEIWEDILVRLPAKSILRCKSVCRSWYFLISCSDFIDKHSTRTPKSNRLLLHLKDNRASLPSSSSREHDDEAELTSFSSHDESFGESVEHDYIAKGFLGRSEIEIVGSCNGLICLSKREPIYHHKLEASHITFMIWNPTMRKIVELPPRGCNNKLVSCFGFGFDSETRKYKILFMVGPYVCEIYHLEKGDLEKCDLEKGVWKKISPPEHSCPLKAHPDFYLDEVVVHWDGYRSGNVNGRILLSFDMSSECFGEIKMPNFAELEDTGDDDADSDDSNDSDNYINTNTRSVAYGGLIHVIVWNVDMLKSCSVWAMKEYGKTDSWTKVFNIDLPSVQGLPRTRLWPHKFLLWKTDEVLVVRDLQMGYNDNFVHKNDLVLYNTESTECKHLYSITKWISNMCLYKESLVLMRTVEENSGDHTFIHP